MLRHPEHLERFAAIHARALEPHVAALDRFAVERGVDLPLGTRRLAVALFAMVTGLSLERLTQPDVVGTDLGEQALGLVLSALTRRG